MKRNILIWVAIGAALVVILNVYPQVDVIPGYLPMPLVIALTIFVVYRTRREAKGNESLVLGRFKPEKLFIIAIASVVFLFLAILLITKLLHPDLSQLKYFFMAFMIANFMLAGIFFFAVFYIFKHLKKRD